MIQESQERKEMVTPKSMSSVWSWCIARTNSITGPVTPTTTMPWPARTE